MRYRPIVSSLILIFVNSCALKTQNDSELGRLNHPTSWWTLGPFLSAPMESLDYLVNAGGEENFKFVEKQSFFSALAPKGIVSWKLIQSQTKKVRISHPEVDWHFLKGLHGLSGLSNMTYAYTTVSFDNPKTLLVKTSNVIEFFVNGRRYYGDPYSYPFMVTPVEVKSGENSILVKIAAYGDPEFTFSWRDPVSPIEVLNDITKPDLEVGKQHQRFWIGLPLLNATLHSYDNIQLKLRPHAYFELIEGPNLSISASFIQKVPLELIQTRSLNQVGKIPVTIDVLSGAGQKLGEASFLMDVKRSNETRALTFKSRHDHSVQYFSVLPPKEWSPQKTYSVLLSLHGANVEATTQISTYAPKDWAFVIAPTNRRPHGMAWQNLGRRDALEVLEIAQSRFPVRSDQVYLVGHSMGGQGVWHLGLHDPDRFAGLSPAAAWMNLDTYTPKFFQRSKLLMAPELSRLRERAQKDTDNPFFLGNAQHLPLYITHSSGDSVVPPTHSRIYRELSTTLGLNAQYREIPSDEHWCAEPKNEGGGYDCVDHPSQYEFLRQYSKVEKPEEVYAKVVDLSAHSKFYWLQILEQEKLFSATEVVARFNQSNLHIETSNLLAFALDPQRLPRWPSKIIWNGREVKKVSKDILWQISNENFEPSPRARTGTTASFFEDPFLITYGTQGDTPTKELLENQARLLCFKIWAQTNGGCRVKRDNELTDEDQRSFNVVILGNTKTHRRMTSFAKSLPLSNLDDEILIGKTNIRKPDLSYLIFYKNPKYPDKKLLFIGGQSFKGLRNAEHFLPALNRSAQGLPDFIIYDEAVKTQGWAGIHAAGFFSKNWDLRNNDYWLRAD